MINKCCTDSKFSLLNVLRPKRFATAAMDWTATPSATIRNFGMRRRSPWIRRRGRCITIYCWTFFRFCAFSSPLDGCQRSQTIGSSIWWIMLSICVSKVVCRGMTISTQCWNYKRRRTYRISKLPHTTTPCFWMDMRLPVISWLAVLTNWPDTQTFNSVCATKSYRTIRSSSMICTRCRIWILCLTVIASAIPSTDVFETKFWSNHCRGIALQSVSVPALEDVHREHPTDRLRRHHGENWERHPYFHSDIFNTPPSRILFRAKCIQARSIRRKQRPRLEILQRCWLIHAVWKRAQNLSG